MKNKNGFGFCWNVSFLENVGDLPLMELDTSKIGGSSVTANVVEVVQGEIPNFGERTMSKEIINKSEVQSIIVTASTTDLGGYFIVNIMGQASRKIFIDFNANDFKDSLQSLSMIDKVDVSMKVLTQNEISSEPSFGRQWDVTFTSLSGNLPSLLIDTGVSTPSTLATGGTVYGSSVRIEVRTVFDGKVPNVYTISELQSEKPYYFKVSSYNGKWSKAAIAPYISYPINQVPSAPLHVRASVVSDTEVGVSWSAPSFSGGSPTLKYFIQWDTDESFNYKSIIIPSVSHQQDYFHLISDLNPSES